MELGQENQTKKIGEICQGLDEIEGEFGENMMKFAGNQCGNQGKFMVNYDKFQG